MLSKKITIIFIIILCFIGVITNVLPVMADQAALEENVTGGLDKTANTAQIPIDTVDKADPGSTVAKLIGEIVGVILSFVGAIFLVLTIYGGFLWMTAGGNDEQVGKAKKIIMSAAVGLLLVLSAYAVSWFVVNRFAQETINTMPPPVTSPPETIDTMLPPATSPSVISPSPSVTPPVIPPADVFIQDPNAPKENYDPSEPYFQDTNKDAG